MTAKLCEALQKMICDLCGLEINGEHFNAAEGLGKETYELDEFTLTDPFVTTEIKRKLPDSVMTQCGDTRKKLSDFRRLVLLLVQCKLHAFDRHRESWNINCARDLRKRGFVRCTIILEWLHGKCIRLSFGLDCDTHEAATDFTRRFNATVWLSTSQQRAFHDFGVPLECSNRDFSKLFALVIFMVILRRSLKNGRVHAVVPVKCVVHVWGVGVRGRGEGVQRGEVSRRLVAREGGGGWSARAVGNRLIVRRSLFILLIHFFLFNFAFFSAPIPSHTHFTTKQRCASRARCFHNSKWLLSPPSTNYTPSSFQLTSTTLPL